MEHIRSIKITVEVETNKTTHSRICNNLEDANDFIEQIYAKR